MALEPPPGWTVCETPIEVRGLQAPQPPQQPPADSTHAEWGPGHHGAGSGSADGGDSGGGGGDALRPVLTFAGGDAAQSGHVNASASPQPASASTSPAVALLRSFYAPGGASTTAPEVSLLILNTVVPEGAQAELAAALLELMEARGLVAEEAAGRAGPPGTAAAAAPGPDERVLPSVVVVAAMLLQQLKQPAALYQHVVNGAPPLDAALPPLQPPGAANGSVHVRDGQLAALLHVLQVSGTAACCLVTPGHKPPASTSLDLPDSLPACDAIGAALAAAYGLRYDGEKCRTIRALHKWFVPEKAAGSDVMYL